MSEPDTTSDRIPSVREGTFRSRIAIYMLSPCLTIASASLADRMKFASPSLAHRMSFCNLYDELCHAKPYLFCHMFEAKGVDYQAKFGIDQLG